MAMVSDLLYFSDSGEPVFIEETSSIYEACKLMKENGTGYLIVEEDGEFSGIISERDIAFKVVADGKNPNQVKIGDIVTRNVITCNELDPVSEIVKKLKDHHIRHLPVIDEQKKIVGLVSQSDIIALLEVNIDSL